MQNLSVRGPKGRYETPCQAMAASWNMMAVAVRMAECRRKTHPRVAASEERYKRVAPRLERAGCGGLSVCAHARRRAQNVVRDARQACIEAGERGGCAGQWG